MNESYISDIASLEKEFDFGNLIQDHILNMVSKVLLLDSVGLNLCFNSYQLCDPGQHTFNIAKPLVSLLTDGYTKTYFMGFWRILNENILGKLLSYA